MVAFLHTVKSMAMMDYGKVLFIPLIIECRLNLAIKLNQLHFVRNAQLLPIVFMIAQRFPATR